MKKLREIGEYVQLMLKVLRKPDKGKIFRQQLLDEIFYLGVDSIGIVAIISVFIGAVLVMKTE